MCFSGIVSSYKLRNYFKLRIISKTELKIINVYESKYYNETK